MVYYWEGKHKDKCSKCERAYTVYLVKWWVCEHRECNHNAIKRPVCSECLVEHYFVEKDWTQCVCSKKILAQFVELSVEELNSKDSWLRFHKDSFKYYWGLKEGETLENEFKQQMEQIK